MTTPTTSATIDASAATALAGVHDPEYPGISVLDMGMIGTVERNGTTMRVELVPTFTGCPAIAFIVADIERALGAIDGVTDVDVYTSESIVWDTTRLSNRARRLMATEFTVGVAVPRTPTDCPRCGQSELVETSAFGPTRCRSIHRCRACGEHVEVMRT